jgi:hypothetical protein
MKGYSITNGVLYQLSYNGMKATGIRVYYSADIFNHFANDPFQLYIIEIKYCSAVL